jgi:multidrug efflux pump subunit AcrA (membrane-fusion protein)
MKREEINQSSTVQSATPAEPLSPEDDQPIDAQSKVPRWRRFLMPALVVLAILGGIGWVVFNRVILPIMIFSQMKPQPTPVQLASPKSATIADSSDYAANLDSRQSVTLQPRVSGQISAIYVQAGDRVQSGASLLQIDAAEQRAQVAGREAEVDTAAAEVESAQADVANATDTLRALQADREAAQANVQLNQREYDRYQELYRQGAESRQLLDQRLNALQTARAELRKAEADIRAQQAEINRTRAIVERNRRALQRTQASMTEGEAQLRYYSINAPFTGTVGNIPVKVGDFVDTTAQLLTVTQNENLEIQIQIPLERSASLRQGLPVQLLDDREQVLQTGRISFVAPNVDPTTQSIQVKASFENTGNLRTAQFVRARVIWITRPGVLVPTSAISRLGGRDFIFVAAPFKDSGCKAPAASEMGGPMQVTPEQLTAVQKPIKLGKIVGNDQEVLEGLSAGDRIIPSGILQLQNCMPIAEAQQ